MSLRKPFAANTASSLADHYDALAAYVEKRPSESDEAEQEKVQRIGQLYRLTADVLRWQSEDRSWLLAIAVRNGALAVIASLWLFWIGTR